MSIIYQWPFFKSYSQIHIVSYKSQSHFLIWALQWNVITCTLYWNVFLLLSSSGVPFILGKYIAHGSDISSPTELITWAFSLYGFILPDHLFGDYSWITSSRKHLVLSFPVLLCIKHFLASLAFFFFFIWTSRDVICCLSPLGIWAGCMLSVHVTFACSHIQLIRNWQHIQMQVLIAA